MTADQGDLKTLSARVFASLPRAADGAADATLVSAALRELHASLRAQLAEQEAESAATERQLDALLRDDAAPREARALLEEIERAAHEADALVPQVAGAEAHFAALVALLAPATQRLQTLDARAKYLATALEIERRSQQARSSAVEATEAALDAFRAFASFVATIPSEYTALRKEAMRRVDELSLGIKTYAVEKLQAALESVEWPRVVPTEELEKEQTKFAEIARAFAYLLTLHVSQLQADDPGKQREGTNQSDESAAAVAITELWAMECVLEPIRMRFKFHFERAGSKTNRVTKPEWWLSHVLDQTRAHVAFLSSILTPELKKHRDTLECVDAQVLFLRGLTLTAMKKLRKDLPVILSERVVFCHTMDEILLFEQLVDEEFGYDSYAASKPQHFPRIVDVLTEDAKILFAWTQLDLEFAKETLESSILGQKDAWNVAAQVPPVAQQFVALLDFMCRRFAHFSNEGHRYVYITQVLFALLNEFQQQCAAHPRQLHVKTLVETQQPIAPFFATVNATQYIVDVLEQWDENPFFIELMRKVTESDKSRTQILKMHLQHSKVMLTNAAKAAKETILAREEAVAVRQAIAGPGAMIGPTAAFSAAYSVGSKTVKSLFGRTADDNAHAELVPETELKEGNAPAPKEVPESDIDTEALLFSRTIFERQVRDYKTLTASLIGELESALVGLWRRTLNRYRKSPMWSLQTIPECIELDLSSELVSAVAVLQRVLTEARGLLSDECFSQLWKPLVATLDDAIFSTVSAVFTPPPGPSSGSGFSLSNAATAIGAVEPISPRSGAKAKLSWTGPARAQFMFDMHATASLFQNSCTKNPRAYLRKTFDLCRLVEMPKIKMTEIHEALRGVGVENEGNEMEQLTSILEACNILTLSPQQVLAFCEDQLGFE